MSWSIPPAQRRGFGGVGHRRTPPLLVSPSGARGRGAGHSERVSDFAQGRPRECSYTRAQHPCGSSWNSLEPRNARLGATRALGGAARVGAARRSIYSSWGSSTVGRLERTPLEALALPGRQLDLRDAPRIAFQQYSTGPLQLRARTRTAGWGGRTCLARTFSAWLDFLCVWLSTALSSGLLALRWPGRVGRPTLPMLDRPTDPACV